MVIAHHLIFTGYGHWLPNDLRGSLSRELRVGKLARFGPIHFGRKENQPQRRELISFLKAAQAELKHPILWFNEQQRKRIAAAFGAVIEHEGYTCFACSVMSNHAHLIIRRHRDKAEKMIEKLGIASADAVRMSAQVPSDHPIWSRDEYKKFVDSPEYLERAIAYVRGNPEKSGLPAQEYAFVKPYRGEWSGRRR